MIPGSNLLEDAFDAIDTIEIGYMKFAQREENAVGQWVAKYEPVTKIEASVQAVDRKTYVELGLDFQKQYVQVYMSADIIDLDRDTSGDVVILSDSRTYQLESQLDWFPMDGWVGVLCVRVTIPAREIVWH